MNNVKGLSSTLVICETFLKSLSYGSKISKITNASKFENFKCLKSDWNI